MVLGTGRRRPISKMVHGRGPPSGSMPASTHQPAGLTRACPERTLFSRRLTWFEPQRG